MADVGTEATQIEEPEEADPFEAAEKRAARSGLGTEVYLGLLWLGIAMYEAHATISMSKQDATGALGNALAGLPDLIVSTVVTSLGIGAAASSLLKTAGRRLLVGLGTGVAFGLVSAMGLRFGYGHAQSITVLALVVGLASVVGSILAALPGAVVEAGLWAMTWVLFLGVMSGVWHDPVTDMLGGGPTATAAAQATANTKFIYGMAIFAGLVSALYASQKLRNEKLRGAWFGVAGALPGVMMIGAEYLSRLGGTSLTQLVHAEGSSVGGLSDWGRLRHALIVFGLGGAVALVVRLLRPAKDDD